MVGGAGNDTFRNADGLRDTIDGGAGSDGYQQESVDRIIEADSSDYIYS